MMKNYFLSLALLLSYATQSLCCENDNKIELSQLDFNNITFKSKWKENLNQVFQCSGYHSDGNTSQPGPSVFVKVDQLEKNIVVLSRDASDHPYGPVENPSRGEFSSQQFIYGFAVATLLDSSKQPVLANLIALVNSKSQKYKTPDITFALIASTSRSTNADNIDGADRAAQRLNIDKSSYKNVEKNLLDHTLTHFERAMPCLNTRVIDIVNGSSATMSIPDQYIAAHANFVFLGLDKHPQ